MCKIMLLTLGNRDLQVKKDTPLARFFEEPPFPLREDKHESWVLTNNDDATKYILNKFHFIPITKFLWEEKLSFLQERVDDIEFSMLNTSLTFINHAYELDKVVLSTSNQKETDSQDCIYEARLIQKLYEDVTIDIKAFSFPPTHFEELVEHYSNLFNNWAKQGYRTVVSNAGGTPDMRAATHFAGFSHDIEFININARKGTWDSRTFKEQKQLVLRNTIESMLNVFDYEGLRKLPIDSRIINKADQAIHLYNFTNLDQFLDLHQQTSYAEKARKGINLLAENMYVSFQQGRYADVLGRIFRFEEAVWQYLFYSFLNDRGFIKGDNIYRDWKTGGKKTKRYVDFLAAKESKEEFLSEKFPSHFQQNHNHFVFAQYPEVSIESGKNFFYYFFLSTGEYLNTRHFFEPINRDKNGNAYTRKSILNHLRNKSILGHGLEGISKEELENLTGPSHPNDRLNLHWFAVCRYQFPSNAGVQGSGFSSLIVMLRGR